MRNNNLIHLLILTLFILIGCRKKCQIVKEYYPNGELKSEFCETHEGDLNGIVRNYYTGNRIASISEWKDGIQDGISISYYENGNVKDSAHIVEGVPHGNFVQFYENGEIKKNGVFSNGNFNGEYFNYYDNGQISTIHHIVNDSPVFYLEYDKDGSYLDKWYISKTDEELFIDINKSSCNRNDTVKVKFLINHLIADSIRLYVSHRQQEGIDSFSPKFRWPEDGSTRFDYSLIIESNKNQILSGVVKYFLKDELVKQNGGSKEVHHTFEVDICLSN